MTDAVDWIENRLGVTGPDKDLQEFVIAAEGPGVLLWERPAGEDLRYWSALPLQGGAPSPRAADRLARRYEDKVYCAIEDARSASERGLLSVPLDLNALIPVPRKVLRKGWHAAGSDWCWEHWAVLASLIETCKLNGVDPQAYLADILARIAIGHPINRLDELLPWTWAANR
jgi:hypothetical protein